MTSRSAEPGDVCEFALGDGRYAYGRVLRDASIAIYRTTSTTARKAPIGERDFLFTVGIYGDVPGSAGCSVVGHDGFDSEEQEWPPPYKVVDPINGRLRIYHHGEMRPADDADDAAKLEKAAVWDLHHLVDRIRLELPD